MHRAVDLSILRGPFRTSLEEAVPTFEAVFAPVRNVLNLPWYLAVYERAGAAGAGVLLTGGRGNFTISASGDRWLHEIARTGRVSELLSEVRAFASARGRSTWNVLTRDVLLPIIPDRPARVLRRLLRSRSSLLPVWEDSLSPIRPEFARALGLHEHRIALGLDPAAVARRRLNEARVSGFEAAGDSFDVAHSLRARFGVETREPAADIRVIRFCLGVPGSFLLRGGRDRRLVRDGMTGLLPRSVLERRTRGAQAADWSEQLASTRSQISAELDALDTVDVAERCLDLPRLRRLVRDWPLRLEREHFPGYGVRLMKGIMVGRFIRWFTEEWA
jgi:asparagine synthase (glutamine-hydrolysing)